jgi:cell division transport system permease protein
MTMRRNNAGYFIRQGLRGLSSHRFFTFAAIGIIAACLIVTGSVALVAVNLEYNLNQLMAENEILAYVEENYSEEETEKVGETLRDVPNVTDCTFVSREDALDSYLDGLEDDTLYTDLPATVLRDRYIIHVEDIAILASTIEQVEAVEGVAKVSAAIDVANGFITVRNVAAGVALILLGVLLVVSFFIISNAIKMATINRAEEIAIMKIVGATNAFVRWPFVVEGIVLGLTSAIIAGLLQFGIYSLLVKAVSGFSYVQLITLLPYRQLALLVSLAYLGIGLLVGVFGSLITIRKFLRV